MTQPEQDRTVQATADGDGVNDGAEGAKSRNPLVNEPAVITIINAILLGD